MTNMITASNLSKSYGKFEALKNINLSIGKGKIVGLIGPSGAGKTTIVRSVLKEFPGIAFSISAPSSILINPLLP